MFRSVAVFLFAVFFFINPLKSQASTVSGKVVDPGNNPIGKISLLLEHMENRNSDSPDTFVIRGETDKDGNFSINLPPSEKQYELFLTGDKGRTYCGFAHIDPKKENNLETIKLDWSCKVSGIVKDKNGKALKEAKVLAQMKTRDKCTHYVNVAETQIKNDGAFEFSDLSSGKYTFQIFPAEFAFEEIETEVNEDFNYLDIVLKGGSKISGKIMDEKGKPLQGAKINTDKKQLSAVSDSEGNFSIGGIKSGDCSLKVTAKGYAIPGYVSVKVDCREAKAYRKDIVLAKTGSLLVLMEPQEKGITIPSKISVALNLYSENHTEWGFADLHADVKDGKALFEEVAPGKYSVKFSSEDAAQLQAEVTIESGKESTLKFILPRTYVLSGKVLDESGKPVKDVNLNLEFTEEKPAAPGRLTYSPGYAQTQADGSFSVKRLKVGKYKVRAEKEDFAKSAQVVNVGPELKEPLAITLKKGLSLGVAILEADGKPAGNVDLTLTSDYDSRKGNDFTDYTSKKLKLSEDGKFKAEGLNPGKYNISVRDAKLNYEITSVFKVEAGSEDTIITLGKTRPVSGKVVDASGSPVSDAEITVSIWSAGGGGISYGGYGNDSGKNKSGTNGDFALGLREGLKYSLRFLSPAYLEKTVDSDPASGNDKLNVVLEKGCSVSGKVIRIKDNSPVEGVVVRVGNSSVYYRQSEREDEETAARRKTDSEGRFSLKTVPVGSVSFSVYSEKGDRPLFTKNVTIRKDQENDIVLTMPEIVSFSGRVIDSEGKPIALTWVSLTSQENNQNIYSPKTDGNGNFEIKDIVPGKYHVRTEKDGYAIFADVVNIGSDSKTPRVITLSKGLDIGGVALEADGKPAVNVELTLVGDNDSRMAGGPMSYTNKKLEISSDGKFGAKGLNPGKYNISARDINLNYEIASVLKIDAGSQDTVITLGKIHTVSVRVEDALGKPVSDAEISVSTKNAARSFSYGQTNNSGRIKTGISGEFILNLREGLKYSLRFSHPGYLGKMIDFDPASGHGDLKVVLGKGCSVSGKVIRIKDNSPVEGVVVRVGNNADYRLMGQMDKATEAKAKTDKEGRFSLETVPSGVVPFSVYLDKQPRPTFCKTLMIKKDQKNDIVLTMPEMVSVTGKVLDPEGNSLPSASVNLISSENYEIFYNARTDGNGVFEIKEVIPGKYSAHFYPASTPGAKIEVNPPELIEIAPVDAKEIVLRKKGKSGTEEQNTGLLKINGKAHNGGKIQFTPMIVGRQPDPAEMMSLYYGKAKSDISAEGKFAVDKLKPGKYIYLVRGDTVGHVYEPLLCSGFIEINKGMNLIDLEVKAFTVSGSVENSEGKPASGIARIKPEIEGVVKAQKETMTLSSPVKDGKYKFDCVPVGKYNLFASDNDSGTFIGNIGVKNEDLEMNVKLPKGFKLSGKVTIQDADGQSFNPLSQAFVFAYSKDQDMTFSGMAGEDGSYSMKPFLNEGEYAIFAVKKDYAVEGVTMKIDKDTEFNISLVPGGDLDLILKSEKISVKDRLVILKDENGREVYRLPDDSQLLFGRFSNSSVNMPTNESGKTTFTGLKPGEYKLSVRDCRISPDTVRVKPLEKATLEVVVQ